MTALPSKNILISKALLSGKDAIHLTAQILKALQHAHECGIVHRDIKPQNIMLLQDGTIKVTDFGIARFSDKSTRTMTEQAIGSVHYIAPEQARGDATDGKTDIYSVGVMLYEMLTESFRLTVTVPLRLRLCSCSQHRSIPVKSIRESR